MTLAPALVGEALGVTVSLLEWRGVNGERVFLLHGDVIKPRFLDGPVDQTPELAWLDISPYLVDLLNVRTPYLWYQPDAADLAAENEYARAIDRAYGH